MPSAFRRSLESVSYPVLVKLTSMPKWLLAIGTAAFLLGGLLAPRPWGPLLMAVVTAFFAWLLLLAWPRLESGSRLMRALIVVALAGVAVARAAGVL